MTSSYQRLKDQVQCHKSVESTLRNCIISMLVDQYNQTGAMKLPFYGQNLTGDDILDVAGHERNYMHSLILEAQERVGFCRHIL